MDTDRQPGIRFEKILLTSAQYSESGTEDVRKKPKEIEFGVQVRSRVLAAEGKPASGEVELSLKAEPKDNQVFMAVVTLLGVFSQVEGEENLGIEEFLEYQGPALLVPFAREAIANLTVRTRFGAILVPPINVRALLVAEQARRSEAEA